MGRRGWGLAGTLLAALLSLSLCLAWLPAGAAPKQQWGPKSVTLRTNGETQAGMIQYLTWPNSSPGACEILNVDGIAGFPDAITHQLGVEARIRLVKRRRPTSASITGYLAVDPNGQPVGPAEEVAFTMERHKDPEGKTPAWHLVFEPVTLGDLYLDVFAEWDDSCSTREGRWRFHTETVPADPPA